MYFGDFVIEGEDILDGSFFLDMVKNPRKITCSTPSHSSQKKREQEAERLIFFVWAI